MTFIPDLSKRSREATVNRLMRAAPPVLFRAWTQEFDRWFAVPGSVAMQPEVGAPFFFETNFDGDRHAHYGRFLKLEPSKLVQLTWVTTATQGWETVVTVALESRNLGTHLNLHHAGFPDEAAQTAHASAWPAVLAQLDERVSV